MTGVIALLTAIWGVYLIRESLRVRRARGKIAHIVHVNGTRGKSSVSRLIDAGLRAGNVLTFCKTTGTDPITIGVDGIARPIVRRGGANIKEQIGILEIAAGQGAQVLVVECMALQPELQHTAQHRILQADVGVITNVRIDHTDVMGESLPQIAEVLSNTVPQHGTLFTAEVEHYEILAERGARQGTDCHCVKPSGTEPEFDFAENIALALAVCRHLGVEDAIALEGMARYQRDPYALSIHRLGEGLFINGLSINDIQSTCMVWDGLRTRHSLEQCHLTLVVNNRADRGSRTQDMLKVCEALKPQSVWLLGASQHYMRQGLKRALKQTEVRSFRSVDEMEFSTLTQRDVLFAIGNIANDGRVLMERVKREERHDVL